MINKSLLISEKPLRVRVAKITGDHAKLTLSDNQSFEINLKYLPASAKVADELYLSLLDEEKFQWAKKEVARELLYQILNKDES